MFSVDKAFWDDHPSVKFIVVYAKGVNIPAAADNVATFEREITASTLRNWQYENAQSHPYIKAWRDFLKGVGLPAKKYQASVELLTKRVLSGKGLYNINPLVNFYNAVSIRHKVSIGAWDVDKLSGHCLRLGYSTGTEEFIEMGTTQATTLTNGEITYFDDKDVITRHFVWRQSEIGLVAESSKNIFFVSEILDCVKEEDIEEMMQTLKEKLSNWFNATVDIALIDSRTATWTPDKL
ncbi:hypothetical protein PRUB_a0809 [Pseudoalteromonas rubra]|uniref:B3/B4 tRNA-binding domain-containing protein n=1 Tax=Pseudoalteromonas rubra TaxID=43658 RepID=A0A8T0C6Q3_9GAMM|nr:phenylalanine--tRNA ligase beta subunit-related protein [Pseudoalteromonas rubra]KAF7786293.1 hypothetical protein PRUB_a0809 [Pseudoalteromonas rubra]